VICGNMVLIDDVGLRHELGEVTGCEVRREPSVGRN
jgi:hypothetical protein